MQERKQNRCNNFDYATKGAYFITICTFFFLFITKANAFVIIEDEETKNFLAGIIKPIYKTAQIPFDENKIYIVLDPSVNAFVIDGSRLFIHTGLITSARTTNEIAGVVAHEAGHIKAGHIFKQKLKIQELQKVSLASMILAGLAGAASGHGEIAMAGIYGTSGALMGQFLEYKKEDERAADNFAVEILKENNIGNEDLANFLARLQQQNHMQGLVETPYFTTHPMTAERIGYLKTNQTKQTKQDESKLKTIQAKLDAFMGEPKKTIKKYYDKNHYATAIVLFKAHKFEEALNYVDWLIKVEPNNPYYHELKGQILFETAKPKEALKSYKKALELLPAADSYKEYVASCLIEAFDDKQSMTEAISLLKQANVKNKSAGNYLQLARAYGKIGDNANALLSSAEYSYRIGNKKLALKQAKQAKKSAENLNIIIKADDIINLVDKK